MSDGAATDEQAMLAARSHARVAALYDRVRIHHSRRALDLVIAETGLPQTAGVVDLAAGTGAYTRLLTESFADVVAIEPEAEMRAFIGGDARAGTAEAIPLADASIDAVFVADGFHWFDAERAFVELARVLRPGGWLVLVWLQWWQTEPPLPAEASFELDALFQRFASARERRTGREWQAVRPDDLFEPERSAVLEDERTLAPDGLVDLISTTSSIAALPDDEREALAEQLRALLHGEYRLPMRHELHWMRRR